MTPLTGMTGVPFASGVVAAVQFEPDGLVLEQEATLTVVPASNVPVQNQTPIGFMAGGNDLHLAPVVVPATAATPNTIQFRIGHFSGAGLASGTSAERVALLLKNAADNQARLEQEIGWYLLMQRQQSLLGKSDEAPVLATISEYLDSFYVLVVQPRIQVASSSCANTKLAVKTFVSYERNYAMIHDGQTSPNYAQNFATLTSAYNSACTGANRYTGTFTDVISATDGTTTTSVSGKVTYLRDDVACAAAGVSNAGWTSTACYRVESVDYTATVAYGGAYAGWTLSPSSRRIQLSNTPVNESYLLINKTSAAAPYQYRLGGAWNPANSNDATLNGPMGYSTPMTFPDEAHLMSDPNYPTTDGKTLTGNYMQTPTALASQTYTWNLTEAP